MSLLLLLLLLPSSFSFAHSEFSLPKLAALHSEVRLVRKRERKSEEKREREREREKMLVMVTEIKKRMSSKQQEN